MTKMVFQNSIAEEIVNGTFHNLNYDNISSFVPIHCFSNSSSNSGKNVLLLFLLI